MNPISATNYLVCTVQTSVRERVNTQSKWIRKVKLSRFTAWQKASYVAVMFVTGMSVFRLGWDAELGSPVQINSCQWVLNQRRRRRQPESISHFCTSQNDVFNVISAHSLLGRLAQSEISRLCLDGLSSSSGQTSSEEKPVRSQWSHDFSSRATNRWKSPRPPRLWAALWD